jgi:signal transduction histidine kinase/ActR/RegA family two-component response regulator
MDADSFELFDDLFEPILVADQYGTIVYYNASFLTLFRTTPRVMKKQSDFKDYFSSIIPDFTSFYDGLIKEDQMLSTELNFIIESQICTIIIKGVKKETGDFVLLFKDVTVEKLLNDKYRAQLEELKNTHSQIIQSDKLKVIGEMTANISHEINNPLTVAIGNSELIGFALESDDLNTQRESITKFQTNIDHSLDRINKIITNMKEFLHKNEDKKEYCDAREIVEKAISFTNPSIKGTSIDVKIMLNGLAPILLINRVKIEQVLVNLIQNAIDSLKDSQTIDPLIVIDLISENNGNFIQIFVKDNGPGISAENRTKIFNTFFTTKEIGKGTGLGLSISNRIIESHQGKLELLESKTGANFKITLPAIGIAGHVNGNWEKFINDSDKLTRVLVVDNEINILNLCMNFLSDSDYHFLGASSAAEAYLELERNAVDIIITDMKMPLIDGENFIRELRTKNINTPVLFMTSKDFVDKYKTMKVELGLKGIIIKPFTKDELVGAIGAAVNE